MSFGLRPFGVAPFGLIKPQLVSTAYTLTAASGTFTLTGQATGFKVGHTLVASQGSYALTGIAAGFKVGHTITAASGAFTLTGNTAGFSVARRLVAASATYSLTGYDATLTLATHNYFLTAETAAYELTGYTATLTVTRGSVTAVGGPVRKRKRRAGDTVEGNRDFTSRRNSRPGAAEEEIADVLAMIKTRAPRPAPIDDGEDDDEEVLTWLL